MEAEVRAVQEPLDWVDELGLQHVIIESDSEMVIKVIRNDIYYLLEIGQCSGFFAERS